MAQAWCGKVELLETSGKLTDSCGTWICQAGVDFLLPHESVFLSWV